jgi:Leucine-rich repeat (LRR) protein
MKSIVKSVIFVACTFMSLVFFASNLVHATVLPWGQWDVVKFALPKSADAETIPQTNAQAEAQVSNSEAHITRQGEVVYVSFNATDEDFVQLEGMRGVKEIRGDVGPNNLGGPKITDAGLAHLRNLKDLEVLELNDALRITDAGLANLAGLAELRELSLVFNRNITDAGLKHLGKLKKLRRLQLYGALITDTGLGYIKDSLDMENLQLGLAPITNAGMVYIGRLPKLKTLDLQGAMITDAGLIHLRPLGKLEWLCLNKTRITDVGLANLSGLVSLKNLYIGETQVTEAGKKALKKNLPHLEIFEH